jgi:dTDP-4-amino-4,6-dideoxygalactose transaminase
MTTSATTTSSSRFAPVLANDFRRQWADLGPDALEAVARVGQSGWYVLGEEVRGFEAELAAWWGTRHAVGVASGLDALEISLRILGCGPGDRVLTTPLSAFATTLAIVRLGAAPVFADTDERGLIDLARCRDRLSRRPGIRYFVPVHLYGHALDGAELRRMREEFELRMVEDCAQSIGAGTGHAGQLAGTSFYPTKNLGAMGDGGAILTDDSILDAQARVLRVYGETERYRHERIGYNSRLDELQAGILRTACLPRLNGWIARRCEIAQAYQDGIRHPNVHCPGAPARSSWHLFSVHVPPERRAAFLEHLKAAGIVAGVHYPTAIPDQPALSGVRFEMADECTIARRICATQVSLPIHPYLTGEEVVRVIDAVNAW